MRRLWLGGLRIEIRYRESGLKDLVETLESARLTAEGFALRIKASLVSMQVVHIDDEHSHMRTHDHMARPHSTTRLSTLRTPNNNLAISSCLESNMYHEADGEG